MENDLSLVLLIFAGIILLLLFIYSFRTRVKPDDLKLLESDQRNHLEADENDVLTLPTKNKEKIITMNDDEELVELMKNASINANKNNHRNDYFDIIDDATVQVEPKLNKLVIEDDTLFTQSTLTPNTKTATVAVQTSKIIKPVIVKNTDSAILAAKTNNIETFKTPLKPAISMGSQLKTKEMPVNFQPNTLLTLHVMPQEDQKFVGYDLLQALLSAKLRFGKMSIFHRYQYPNEQGKILFSTAQVTEPGTFSMDKMGTCQCSGLIVFMQLLGSEHDLEAMELFIQTAQQLADNLDGLLMAKRGEAFTPDVKKQFAASVRHHLDKIGIVA